MQPTPNLTDYMQSLVETANACAYAMLGYRNSCILTSYALADVLCSQGFNAYPLRIEAHVFPGDNDDRRYIGTTLGWDGDGTRRPAAKPGCWHGHLGVAVDRDWLLDPTIDSANKPDWPAQIGPTAIALPPEFWDPPVPYTGRRGSVKLDLPGIMVRWVPYRKQVGFASAGDARPSHWRPLAAAIWAKLGAHA
jgi:hypothetical protein